MDTIYASGPISVRTEHGGRYDVWYEPLERAPSLMSESGLRRGGCLLVSDERVADLYGGRLATELTRSGWEPHLITVPAGEGSKALEQLDAIYTQALRKGLDRKTPLLALGGGVVGDLAGFAAATLLRGIPLVHLPTTLVAQVDSSIGGKTGINHALGKNLIGSFLQPRLVIADLSTLQSLSDREWASGLAEVVKHGLISDAALFDYLDTHWEAVLARDRETVAEMVPRATRVKIRVVETDVLETGPRAHLNFGHTFGHAIERVAGYGTFTHGEAVSVGMQAALHLSQFVQNGFPLDASLNLVRRIPVASNPAHLPFSELVDAMRVDKKSEAGTIRFVLLSGIGQSYLRSDVSVEDMQRAWEKTVEYFTRST